MKRLFAFIISITVALSGALPVSADTGRTQEENADKTLTSAVSEEKADKTLTSAVSTEEEQIVPAKDLPGSRVLLEQYIEEAGETYVEEAMNEAVPSQDLPKASARYWKLGEAEKRVYLAARDMIKKVASGQEENTKITMEYSEIFSADVLNAKYTAADLGVDSVDYFTGTQTEDGADIYVYAPTDEAKKQVQKKYPLDMDQILTALLRDFPQYLYWFDKTIGITEVRVTSCDIEFGDKPEEDKIWCMDNSSIELRFWVSADYRGTYEIDDEGNKYYYYVNKTATERVNTALANIANLVKEAAELSDHNKLKKYKDKICENVTYDSNAADKTKAVPYGDPWQLISVFDNDPATNVVCEGYAKAFKYLCDMTEFTDSSISCSIVTGTMGGGTGAGLHMWNLVTIGTSNNYLVDVTNCDEGTIGATDKLFLVGNESSEKLNLTNDKGVNYDTERYAFPIDTATITYEYDADTVGIFELKERELAASSIVFQDDDPGTGDDPNPGSGDDPNPGSGDNPNPGSGDDPNPGSGDDPNPGSGDNPNPGSGDDPNPGTGDDPNPGTGDDPNPGTGDNPNPGTGDDPNPGTIIKPIVNNDPKPAATKPLINETATNTPSDAVLAKAGVDNRLSINVSGISTKAQISKKKMILDWADVAGATNYKIAYRQAGAAKWTEEWTGGASSKTISGLSKNGLYEFKLMAIGRNGSALIKSNWSKENYRFFASVKQKVKAGKKSVTVKTAKLKKASGYEVLYGTSKNFAKMKVKSFKGAAKTKLKVKGLKKGKKYYICIRPYKTYKGHRYLGVLSAVKKVKVR